MHADFLSDADTSYGGGTYGSHPDEILLVDRMGKRYVRATRKELKDVLPKKADFAHLEKLLYAASKPNGKKVLTGKELGIPSLEKGKIELSNFLDKPFALTLPSSHRNIKRWSWKNCWKC